MRKLTVHDHMTHMIGIDCFTGHEGKGNLHFDLKIIFIAHLSKTMHFLKTWVNYESITYCLMKFR